MGNMLANKKIRTLLICLALVPLVFGIVMAAGAYASKARTTNTGSPLAVWVKKEPAAEFPNFDKKLHSAKPDSPPDKREKVKDTQEPDSPKSTGKEPEEPQKPVQPVQQAPVPSAPGTKPAQQSDTKPAQPSTPASQPAENKEEAPTPGQNPEANPGDAPTPQQPATNPGDSQQPAQLPGDKPAEQTPAVPAQNKPAAKPPAPTAPGKQRELYLTFDDGPHRVSNQILDLLDKYNAKATFFMLDGNMKQYPDAVKRMASSGHSIGMHGVTHNKQKFYHSAQTVVAEMDQGRETIKRITGIDTFLIRTPFGSSPYMTPEYKKAVAAHQYKMWDWNVDSRDWYYRDRRYVDSAIEQIEKQKGRPGPIVVLLHERDETLACLPALLDYLKSQNFKLLPLTSSMVPVQFK